MMLDVILRRFCWRGIPSGEDSSDDGELHFELGLMRTIEDRLVGSLVEADDT